VNPETLKETVIEFEVRSKTFQRQEHDERKCNLIVCWDHNWKECPDSIDVIEIRHFWKMVS
jgi:hypothetical protein